MTTFETLSPVIAGPRRCTCVACSKDASAETETAGPRLFVNPPGSDTVPGNATTSATIAIGSSALVAIETLGDRDWYRVSLTAGTTYTIHTTSTSAGSRVDTYLALRNASGVEVASDDDGGNDFYSLISYTPTTSGTFFIDAGTYADGETGTFHLSIAPVLTGGDSVGASVGTAATLAVGGSVNGNIDTSFDRDWYAVTLVAGQTYLFRTGGVAVTTNTDTVLTLRDAAGTRITSNDDAGEAFFSAIRYTAPTSGTYYLDVSVFQTPGAFNLTAFATATPAVYTVDQIAQHLVVDYWEGEGYRFNVTAGGSLTYNIQALTAAGQVLARHAIALWGDATGIVFSEVTTGGQIVYDDDQDGASTDVVFAGGFATRAIVNVSTAWIAEYGTSLNSYSAQTYVHETGHALGLGHAGFYNGEGSYALDALYQNDGWPLTVMSYFDQREADYFVDRGFSYAFTPSPMIADGVAVSRLYGTATTTRTGDTTYGFNSNAGRAIYDATQLTDIAYTIFDNGGIDTLDYSGFTMAQVINLEPESFSNVGGKTGNVGIARGSVIENAIGGAGADTITGNAAANTLHGGGGADTLNGGGGADVLIGGSGNDVLTGGAGGDIFRFAASGEGADRISDFATAADRFDLGGGSFTGVTVSGANSVLTHAGGTIEVTGVTGLNLSQWNALRVGAAPLPDAPGYALIVPGGAAASVAGPGQVFGGTGLQQVTVVDAAGRISFDGSFNTGGDRIVLAGGSGAWSVSRAGATVTLSDGDTIVTVPVGTGGADIVFGDGVRSLSADLANNVVRLGSQAITATAAPVTAAAGAAVVTGPADAGIASQLIVNPGASVRALGTETVFGSSATGETVSVGAGARLAFDGSFNAGGDVIVLPGAAASYGVGRSGATVTIAAGSETISVPAGPAGLTVRFADGDRALVFDQTAGVVRLGSQIVTPATAPVSVADHAPTDFATFIA